MRSIFAFIWVILMAFYLVFFVTYIPIQGNFLPDMLNKGIMIMQAYYAMHTNVQTLHTTVTHTM